MPTGKDEEFDKNVFINCPFDPEYYPLLRPLLFVVVYLGFNPKIALERSDSGELRMPFELGIEYGCRYFSRGRLGKKRCLILEKQRFDYMKALSDLSGVDIKSHGNDPIGIVREVRNWFVETVGLRNVESPKFLWFKVNDFLSDFYAKRESEGFSHEDLNMMPVPEFVSFIRQWIRPES